MDNEQKAEVLQSIREKHRQVDPTHNPGFDIHVGEEQPSYCRIAFLIGEYDAIANAALDVNMERDMAMAYSGTLQRHLRRAHACDHDFSEVANAGS